MIMLILSKFQNSTIKNMIENVASLHHLLQRIPQRTRKTKCHLQMAQGRDELLQSVLVRKKKMLLQVWNILGTTFACFRFLDIFKKSPLCPPFFQKIFRKLLDKTFCMLFINFFCVFIIYLFVENLILSAEFISNCVFGVNENPNKFLTHKAVACLRGFFLF